MGGCSEGLRSSSLPCQRIEGKLGVISSFSNQALFQRVGTTTADNVSFYRRLPKLNFNSFLFHEVLNQLARIRNDQIVLINHLGMDNGSSDLVGRNLHVTPSGEAYLKELTSGMNLDYILALAPEDWDFSQGEYEGDMWHVSGYGLFNDSFLFLKKSVVFLSLRADLIDAKSDEVYSQARALIQVNRDDIKVIWHKGYLGVSDAEISKMSVLIRKKLPPTLKKLLSQLHLLQADCKH